MVIFFLKSDFVHCSELSSVYFLLSFFKLFQEILHYQKHPFTLCLMKYSPVLWSSKVIYYNLYDLTLQNTQLLSSTVVLFWPVTFTTCQLFNNEISKQILLNYCLLNKNVTLLWLLLTYDVYPMFKFLTTQLQVEILFLRHFLVY